ncbi:MAG: hypothetical protein H8E66_00240 [Planctomycetes bacterium]|nr:hypothetical protein [Planctomycetota bacterium]
MPTAPQIELELKGSDDDELVYFTDFRAFCAAVAECLKRSESIVTGSKGKFAYRVAKMELGSAKMTLEAVRTERARGRDKRAQVVRFFGRTVTAIQGGKKVDNRLGIEDVKAFKKLANPLHRRSKSVRIGDTTITSAFESNADRILNDTFPTDGFVSGRLDRLNVHDRNEFVLFPPIHGYSIVCRFGDGMLDAVREAIKHTVTVSGTLHYTADSPFPRLVNVRTMEIHPSDDELPSLSDLRGSCAGCTGDMTAVDFVRQLRND